ncbi:ABC transporter ATP-binding protein/permease [Companilactobacillus allii]|uniref:Multidrug ABC transporter permease n=1 Tax=Companilactobacillus allii TaxID=1847728 RepID=A0A1P8Q1S9_9LACO|nr:ABC transporter ATP-binding protein [Companilactobacillus allii]APX71781.1 multidrug ABC transporter permease [Companilactobacillus allii]USQ68869.1 ABC transporter ATP-binding protein/permease [Companilactobacillus allii]
MFKIIMEHIHGKARVFFFMAPVIMLGEVFCDLQQPTLMSQIIDSGLAKNDMRYVLQHAALMAMFAVLGLIFGGASGVLGSYASLNMGKKLRSHMLSIALEDRDPSGLEPATLITRITNDVTQMQTLVMMLTRGMVRSPMLLFGGIVMSVIICPDLAPILFVIMPILVVFLLVVVRRSIPMYTKMQQSVDTVNRIMRENLQGAKTIKAYVLENHQLDQFNSDNNQLLKTSQNASMATVILSPVIQLMLNLGVVVALGYGGSLSISNTISNGQIIAFVNYMIQITSAMIQTVNIITSFSRAVTSSTRVQAVLSEEKDEELPVTTMKKPVGSSISFDDVTFGYKESEPIINHLSFEVKDGEWMGIIGATGSGKSSIINLLTRSFDQYSGTIKIDGVDIKKLSLEELHQKVVVALQDSLLLSGNIRSNLAYGKMGATDTELDTSANISDSAEFIDKLHKRYDAQVEQKGKNFSGGQRQRLNIARSLTPNADILVMDDATSAVDQETNARIKSRLKKSRNKKTTLIISQRVTNVMDCDQIMVIADGKLESIGTHDELLTKSNFYRQLVKTQLGGGINGHA